MEKKTIAILAIAAAGTAALGACIAKCASNDKNEEKESKGVEPIDFDDEDDDDWDDDLDDNWDEDDDLWDDLWDDLGWDDLGGSTETEEDRDRIYENAASNIQRLLKKYDVSDKDKDAPAIAVDMVKSYCKALSNSSTKSLNIEIAFGDQDSDNYSKVRYGAND